MTEQRRSPESDSTETFPSAAHRLAWFLEASLAPLPSALPVDLAAGGHALHAFFRELYAGMRREPTVYGLVEAPDLVYEDGEWAKERPDVVRNQAQNAHVLKALEALLDLLRLAEPRGEELWVSGPDSVALLAEIRPKSISRPRIKRLLGSLARHGLSVEIGGDVTITATPPEMLLALKTFAAQVNEDNLAMRRLAFVRCDLQALQEDYRPGAAGLLAILPADLRRRADAIVARATASGYAADVLPGTYPSAAWALTYSGNRQLKTGPLLRLGYSYVYRHPLSAELHCINPRHLAPLAEAKGPDYVRWFSSQWHSECSGCGYCRRFSDPGPYRLEVDGRRRGLCHSNWVRFRNPDDAQTADLLQMLDLHSEAGMV